MTHNNQGGHPQLFTPGQTVTMIRPLLLLTICCLVSIEAQVCCDWSKYWPQYSPLIGPENEYCGQVSYDWSAGHNTLLWLVQRMSIVARWAVIGQLATILSSDWSRGWVLWPGELWLVSWPQYSPLIGPDDEYCGQVSCDWSAGHNTHLWLVQGQTSDQTVEQYYAQLDRGLLDRLYRLYEMDFLLFNYSAHSFYGYLDPQWLVVVSCKYQNRLCLKTTDFPENRVCVSVIFIQNKMISLYL